MKFSRRRLLQTGAAGIFAWGTSNRKDLHAIAPQSVVHIGMAPGGQQPLCERREKKRNFSEARARHYHLSRLWVRASGANDRRWQI